MLRWTMSGPDLTGACWAQRRLLLAPMRTYNVQSLHFLRLARSLGFSVAQMLELLALWRDEGRASADVKRLALSHAVGAGAAGAGHR